MSPAILPLALISETIDTYVYTRAILLAIFPLPNVPATIRPRLVALAVKLIGLELTNVL